jgi:crotonobetainyl-CoA:carnitine CoA-transferase CaiB-like acyl-CoA transferase
MLKHIKVLDFSKLLPGPYATMILADLEAEIYGWNPRSFLA